MTVNLVSCNTKYFILHITVVPVQGQDLDICIRTLALLRRNIFFLGKLDQLRTLTTCYTFDRSRRLQGEIYIRSNDPSLSKKMGIELNNTNASSENRVRAFRPNYGQLHRRPLPLEIYPLPAFIPHNPLSYFRVIYVVISQYLNAPSSHFPLNKPHKAFYSAATRSVHVTDPRSIRALWECGFFGKGSLSRSEPEWLEREKRRLGLVENAAGQTSAEVTGKRREERKEVKKERAKLEREAIEEQLRREGKLNVLEITSMNGHLSGTATNRERLVEVPPENIGPEWNEASSHVEQMAIKTTANTDTSHKVRKSPSRLSPDMKINEPITNQEHLQLTPVEAFFLAYGLGTLNIHDPSTNSLISTVDLLTLFRRTSSFPPIPPSQPLQPDDPFLLSYVVYHHFRSLGWVVRSGIKFAVDFLLYNRGPVFSHAEFAVLIMPSYGHAWWSSTEQRREEVRQKERKTWWWLHCANRVQSQVRKSLVLVYVEVPPLMEAEGVEGNVDIGRLLGMYRVSEFALKRWTPNRNRD